MIRGAIFDLDGTLIDSLDIWETMGEDFLRARGINPPAGIGEAMRPLSLTQSLEYMRQHAGLVMEEAEFFPALQRQMEERYRRAPLQPHARAFLQALRDAGVRCCVATASDGGLAQMALEAHGIHRYFAFVITCEQAGAGKDRPDVFLQAMERMGTGAADTVVFEDSIHAVQTAKGAGLRVAVLEERHAAGDREALRALADHYYQSFEECEVSHF